MLRRSISRYCSAAVQLSLSTWLAKLAEQVEALGPNTSTLAAAPSAPLTPASNHDQKNSSCTTEGATLETETVWQEILQVATHAHSIRETDTAFALCQALFLRRQYPPDERYWITIAEQLLGYGGIEATSVLKYPGKPDAFYRQRRREGQGRPRWSTTSGESAASGSDGSGDRGRAEASSFPYMVYPSREILLLTGGVMPLSARMPCGDGQMISIFLRQLTQYVRWRYHQQLNPSAPTAAVEAVAIRSCRGFLRELSSVVRKAISMNETTIQVPCIRDGIMEYCHLLHELDIGAFVALRTAAAVSFPADADTSLLLDFLEPLGTRLLSRDAIGIQLTTAFLAAAWPSFSSSEELVERWSGRFPGGEGDHQRASLKTQHQRYFLLMLRRCSRNWSTYYTAVTRQKMEEEDELEAVEPPGEMDRATRGQDDMTAEALRASRAQAEGEGLEDEEDTAAPRSRLPCAAFGVLPLLQQLYNTVDVLFQTNANRGNPLQIDADLECRIKEEVAVALLGAMRVEIEAPDDYLRQALEVVERVPSSMAVEAELIAGKLRLLELDTAALDDDGRGAVYADLVASLRSLVDMRPHRHLHRADVTSTPPSFATPAGAAPSHSAGGREMQRSGEMTLEAMEERDTDVLLQSAHAMVLQALSASQREELISDAYSILVSHKYHGLKIRSSMVHPVMAALSRRGDCRAFNLVDLCVLYSNETVDMTTISYLFKACATAGDHYRARTLLQLIQEIVPGFLVKCPPSLLDTLRELKVVEAEPAHLFFSAEEKMVQAALGNTSTALRPLPSTRELGRPGKSSEASATK